MHAQNTAPWPFPVHNSQHTFLVRHSQHTIPSAPFPAHHSKHAIPSTPLQAHHSQHTFPVHHSQHTVRHVDEIRYNPGYLGTVEAYGHSLAGCWMEEHNFISCPSPLLKVIIPQQLCTTVCQATSKN